MPPFIRDWNDVYTTLKRRAETMRGAVEIHVGTPDYERWPRTTGADVVAIAAVVDRHVRRLRAEYGDQTVHFRWRRCLQDISRYALKAPGEPYAKNREFWNCFVATTVHLASIDAALPDAPLLAELSDKLGHVLALRNIGPSGDGPFKHFDNVKTFHHLYLEQYKYLRALRGFDDLDPDPGQDGGNRRTPRTTNGDVVQLADYWSRELDDARTVMGRDSVERQWRTALIDVDRIARPGDPNALYPKNNMFWRALFEVGVYVSVADEQPTKWDLAYEAVKDSIKKLPERIGLGAGKVADVASEVAGDVAHGVGGLANQVGRGLFSGLGPPLLIGGGLLGWFLLSRSGRSDGGKD